LLEWSWAITAWSCSYIGLSRASLVSTCNSPWYGWNCQNLRSRSIGLLKLPGLRIHISSNLISLYMWFCSLWLWFCYIAWV
jgi:hypothetical protein